MPRLLRFVPSPGTLVEVTTRTIQSRLLLQPSPAINDAVIGVLGRAQKMYGMVVHLAVVLSNHYHLLLAPNDAKHLADFMTFVNSNIAREVGRIVDWNDRFWSRRYQAILVSDEEAAQLERLEYFLANAVKEHLVEHPCEWPGVHSARALIEGETLQGSWFDRSAYHRARRRRAKNQLQEKDFMTRESLHLAPLPCLQDHAPGQARIVEELADRIAKAAALIRKAEGKMVLGKVRVRKQHPHTRPSQTKSSPAPRFHAFAAAIRNSFREAYNVFTAAFRIAAQRLRGGDRGVVFPAGSFPSPLPFSS